MVILHRLFFKIPQNPESQTVCSGWGPADMTPTPFGGKGDFQGIRAFFSPDLHFTSKLCFCLRFLALCRASFSISEGEDFFRAGLDPFPFSNHRTRPYPVTRGISHYLFFYGNTMPSNCTQRVQSSASI